MNIYFTVNKGKYEVKGVLISFLTLLYMGDDQNDPPRLIIVQQSSWNALNGLIFHDFVPCNIRKFLGSPFLGFLFRISKKFYVDNFFHIKSKGGTLLYVKKCIYFGVLFRVNNGNDSTPNA